MVIDYRSTLIALPLIMSANARAQRNDGADVVAIRAAGCLVLIR
jgi:hypothetical protein